MMMATQLGDPFSLEVALQHIAANPVSEFGDCAAEASVGQGPSDKGCTEAAASGHVDQAVAAAAGACLAQQQAVQPAVVERSHPSDESEGAMEVRLVTTPAVALHCRPCSTHMGLCTARQQLQFSECRSTLPSKASHALVSGATTTGHMQRHRTTALFARRRWSRAACSAA